MPLKMALRQPLALVLLGAGLVLAIAMAVVPALDPWSGRAPLVFGLGLLAYFATVVIFACCQPEVRAPEVRQVQGVRAAIARRLASVRYERPAWAPIVAKAIDTLDDQILPALRQLVLRQRGLADYLCRYDAVTEQTARGRGAPPEALPAPDPAVLERVRVTFKRHREAIDECVQQAVNAEATLVALLAAGDDAEVGTKAREWAGDLLALHDFLDEALRGDPPPELVPESLAKPLAEELKDIPTQAVPLVNETEMVRLTEEALRELNNHFALAKCGLLERIPRTLTATRQAWGASRLPGATPFEQAQALHEVLVQAIERLKPVDDSRPGEQALLYHVLRDRYLEGKEIRQIEVRRSISERTVHRYTRQGREAIARELREQ